MDGRAGRVREREVVYAARWAGGAFRGATLHTPDGAGYRVVYEGRRGGPAGPDFRDAVLMDAWGGRLCGDVELHLRASGWRAHGHHRDPRYAGVVLHVVVHPPADGEQGSPLVTGDAAPIVLLGAASDDAHEALLPCAGFASRVGVRELHALLEAAGDARFVARAEGFRGGLAGEALPAAKVRGGARRGRQAGWGSMDWLLFTALAEALGFGRDRAALRLAGERLAEGVPPEHVRADVERAGLPAVERTRLRGLLTLHRRWEEQGPWAALRRALEGGRSPRAARAALIEALRVDAGAISAGRAAIVAVNVVLPFAAGWAVWADERQMGERARAVFAALPSNAITRLMARQLGLSRLPPGARSQQGLHHIWAGFCREKRCENCPCNLPAGEPGPLRI